jgi:hypothetical protein
MKDQMLALLEKAKENKDLLIRLGGITLGAALGALIATAISNAQTTEFPIDPLGPTTDEMM